MKPDRDLEETIKHAAEHVMALQAERKSRPDGLFPEDERIATEAARELYWLGRMRNKIIEQQDRWRLAMAKNDAHLDEIDAIYADLQTELAIAAKNELPTP